MKKLSDKDIEMMANQVALELEAITDEQAVDSDFGGDSDAEDKTLDPKSQISATPGPSTSSDSGQHNNFEENNDSSSDLIPTSANSSDNDVGDSRQVKRPRFVRGLIESEDSDQDIQMSTQQDFIWSKEASEPKLYKEIIFTEPFGPKVKPKDTTSPLHFFSLFFTEFFLLEMAAQSNLYATQNGHELKLSVEELRAWLGVIIFMGFHSLPSMRLYWSRDENFHCERIARVMSIKRFLKILGYLHLADNSQMPARGDPNFDRLYKVRPLLDYFGEKFKISFSPSRYVSIDESMVAFKGRSSMKQYMPQKPIKRGFKIWVMCCAVTGYMVSFDVYTGKDPSGASTDTLGERVVLKLSQALEGIGYCIFFDNFFTSMKLIFKLLKKRLFSCGTFRTNRKHFPHEFLKSNKAMKKSDMDFAMSEDISLSKWMDRGSKPVTLLSSMHNPSKHTKVKRTNVKGEREEVPCPESISDYNQFMGGVDRMDQMLSAYSVAQKSRRWWIKLFYYFIDCAIVNCFILYKETTKKNNHKAMSHLQFRSLLVNELINKYSSKSKPGYAPMKGFATKRKSGATTIENTIRHSNVGIHLPEKIKGWRRCAGCSTKEKEKRSNVICKTCNVALCKNCFTSFHS